MSPGASNAVETGDDADVLDEPEHALRFERVAEHLVPAGEHLDGERAVEVEEVEVRYVTFGESVGEDEHEAFFHAAPGREEEAPDRKRDHSHDDGDRPCRGGIPSQPETPSQHERCVRRRGVHEGRC